MREWCNCGSGIRSFSPRRIDAWRQGHNHSVPEQDEPEKHGASAQVERSYQFDDREVSVGFVRDARRG